ncbi:MAG: VanW family protein [Bacillota bacterium]
MEKTRKTPIIFLLILIQSILAVFAASAVLFGMSLKNVPSGVYAADLYIGDLSYSEAAEVIRSEYGKKFGEDSLKLEIEGKETYLIPFSRIDAYADGQATLQSLNPFKDVKNIPGLLSMYFGSAGIELRPVVRFNESKLRQELIELSGEINIYPVDARIYYEGGTLKKSPDSPGIMLNVSNAVDVISRQLSKDPFETVKLSSADNYALEIVKASVTMNDFDMLQQVIAEYSTRITDDVLSDSVRLAIDAINGVILDANEEGKEPPVFSFVDCIKKKDASFENDNEGYDLVASTLYAALLKTGMPVDSITRLPHKMAVDYIEPGLDSWISGNAGDLKFTNPFKNKIAIFAEKIDDRVVVAIAGSLADKPEKIDITTEIVQRFDPPVYYVENNNLKQGEKLILNPGKEGIVVNVYRNGTLIGTDEYEAEKTIIQIGPGSESINDSK